MKEKRKKAQINKIQNEREEITKDITESQKHKDYKRILRATIHQQPTNCTTRKKWIYS